MKYCVCGKELAEDSKYCCACGKSQESTEEKPTRNPLKPVNSWLNITNIYLVAAIANVIILSMNWVYTFELGHALVRGNPGEINSIATGYDNIQDFLVFQIIYALIFLVWVYKTYKILPVITGEKSRWSPGWAIGSWFVPVLNLWRPCQVMAEIWKKSSPNPVSGNKIFSWWLILLMATIKNRLSESQLKVALSSNSVTTINKSLMEDCYSIFFLIGAVIWTIYLVVKISGWQKKRITE
jgi:hypothetical protein